MTPRNVLLLVADDLGKQLGCYGCPYIQTPNIDKLAAEGARFENAFASTASCSGSRSTIYTGLHTHQNGQYGLNSGKHHFMTFDHIESGPALLAKNGVRTGIIGKVHVGPDAVYPWEWRAESLKRDVWWSSQRAAEFFNASKDDGRPFVLTVGYHDPHRDRTRGGFGNDEPVDERIKNIKYRPADMVVPGFLSDSPGVRQELASYAEAISRLDQGIGMILHELEESEFAKDTLVIFMSDNGPPFLNSKTTLYDAGIRLPLIAKLPGAGSSINPNLVSYVDILPTILDWILGDASDGAKSQLAGRSFFDIINENHELAKWDHVFGSHTFHESTNYWPTRYIRTRRYKYHRNIAWRLDFPFANDIYGSLTWEDIRNADQNPKMIGERQLKDYFFRPAEELYDLVNDPNEVRNLAKDPDYQDVLEELQTRLEDWQRRTNDPWLFRDGISILLNKHHLDAGLEVPDKWDLDIEHPETKGDKVKKYQNLPFGVTGPRS
ncbi:alkaline-phosphatase-like protein [Colletotrichum phormii]|uniref:Alkaline-phosphatase-like protein n=1 Tax=Colletotrichum phormii TaxID=359342 RepID=A0AAJ0A1X1_9PEZI|nr:alkaline-phosphatase-like protein [Colletotrichum phormii]KAK1654958.1 alkaline-phosphatase-like protein [Colletotrichum phormii]